MPVRCVRLSTSAIEETVEDEIESEWKGYHKEMSLENNIGKLEEFWDAQSVPRFWAFYDTLHEMECDKGGICHVTFGTSAPVPSLNESYSWC